MDEGDGNRTPTTPPEMWQEEKFQYVTRKRRGKKKGKTMSLFHFKNNFANEQNSTDNNLTTGDDIYNRTFSRANASDSDLEETDSSSDVKVIYGSKVDENDDEVYEIPSTSSVTLDGVMSKPPQINSEDLPLESKDEKLEYQGNFQARPIDATPRGEIVNEIINKRALPKDAPTYQLEKFEKHALLVFNQTNIKGYKPRLGTEKDVAELKRTFGGYGFEVQVEEDLTKMEIMQKLKEFSSRDFTDYGCVAVAVLTHGSEHGLLRAKDLQYNELDIVNHLQVYNKPTLVTKPKLVIIQACRGAEDIRGVTVFSAQGNIMKDLDEEVEPYTLPVESDMLILHSSYIGKPSHRDELLGSWFIQSFCSKINQLAATHDLESIITEVKREVAIDRSHIEHNRRTFETDINKQMPVLTSTLIRKLYLKRFGEEAPMLRPSENTAQMTNNSVMDYVMPSPPLLVQFGPCACFLEHYNYITKCLRFHLEDNPADEVAKVFLDVAATFDDGAAFNSAKGTLAKRICEHLKKTTSASCSRYLYFYKH